MNTSKHSSQAQNSIDYIVYSNPKPIRQLLYDFGYEAPKNDALLVKATKELIQKKGQSVIERLLKVHPDKDAILSLNTRSKNSCHSCNNDSYNAEDNFCSSCGHSNYNGTGDEDSFLDQFNGYSDKELQRYYNRIVKISNSNPEDKKLASEVQIVWNELRQRKLVNKEKDTTASETKNVKESSLKNEVMLWVTLFIGGFLVGTAVVKKQ